MTISFTNFETDALKRLLFSYFAPPKTDFMVS